MITSTTSSGTTELKIACVSDIHLFHRKNPTEDMVRNLDEAFCAKPEITSLDILFIAGDVFDTIASFSDNSVHVAVSWVTRLLRLCKNYDIILRVLEGTPSHDRKQSAIFETQNKVCGINADFRYVKELEVEHISKFGINVLYVPDEINSRTEKTLEQVKALIEAKGLQQVDFAVMHGVFEHQLPPVALKSIQHHSSSAYTRLVKDTIFIGHHHKFSVKGKIVAQGSFDRTGHGAEEPKGYVRLTTDLKGNRQLKFVETTNAKKFVTVDVSDLSLEDSITKIDEYVVDLPDFSHVRIVGCSDNPIFTNVTMLIRKYPALNWEKKQVSTIDVEEEVLAEVKIEDYAPITLTKDNIAESVITKLSLKSASSEVLERCKCLLERIVRES